WVPVFREDHAQINGSGRMDFALSTNQESISDAVGKICSRFDDIYWLKKDKEGGFPADFHMALADAGWLGICIPEEFGGSGLGITDAAFFFQAEDGIRDYKVTGVQTCALPI